MTCAGCTDLDPAALASVLCPCGGPETMTTSARKPGRPPLSTEGGRARKVTARLPVEAWAELEALATRWEMKPGEVVREAILEYLERPPKNRPGPR